MKTPDAHLEQAPARLYAFSDFRLDTLKRVLQRRDGTAVPLNSRAFDTLAYLVQHSDAVLDKERIMEAVWPDSIVEENNLTQSISALRRALGEKPDSHNFIVTVPGRGYRFVAAVKEVDGEQTPAPVGRTRFVSRTRRPLLFAALAIVLFVGVALLWKRSPTDRSVIARPNEKSIAVLPFDNLSDEKENTYFAAGIQDEILSDLAQIADLKVISRTSANLYKSGNPRNSRDIGEQLGVAHLLEGSVQRAGNRLRVNAQLVDTRTDMHLWAQTYDRDVSDLFVLQSEIAKAIADQLRAKISPAERAAITQPSTTDPVANDLYWQALDLEFKPPQAQDHYPEELRLLEEAVARDPKFVRAYCKIAGIHLMIYFGGDDPTPARRDLAKVAIENAARVQPDAGEVHLARARYYYHGFRDYDRARTELDLARRTLPNEPSVPYWSAHIDRRQGRFADAVKNFTQAVELDPRNSDFLATAAVTFRGLRRYSEERRLAERAIKISPANFWFRIALADRSTAERADLQPLRNTLDAICAEQPEAVPDIVTALFYCALLERDPVAVNRALALIPPEGTNYDTNFKYPREWFAGFVARTFGDSEAARSAFTAARAIAEKMVHEQPDYAPAWSLLGRIDAALGRKEDAIKEGRRACELLPTSRDAWAGPYYVKDLATIYAWTGESDLAFDQLAQLSAKGLHYGELKLDPTWDALRGDPRFEKLLASLAPSN